MRSLHTAILLALTVWAGAQPVLAQTVDPTLEDARRKALELRTNELGSMQPRGGTPDPGVPQEAVGPCFKINTLTVTGATLLTPAQIAGITQKYVPRCMQGADIQAVMRELDGTYADRGYITSKTYIPPQNLTEGALTLTMLEGRVEDVLLIDDKKQIETPRGARQLAFAFPGAKGGLFQLRDFEQGLDQMNRLASVQAVLKLQPGEQPGGSYVVVQRVQNDRFRGYAHLDNQGSTSTGKNKLSFDVEVDDMFGVNDTWTLGYNGSENTNALSVSGSVPYGYWTFDTDLSYSEYLTPLSVVAELFGTSFTAGIGGRYIANRDQTTTTELNFGLRTRKSDRYINDALLTPQNLTTVDFGVKYMRLGDGSRNSYDATLTFGTTFLGADKDVGNTAGVPQAQFARLNGGWQRQAGLVRFGTLVTDLRVQLSPHSLYGSEQMSLGSYSTVRGYVASVATGDQGFYLRNDLYLSADIWNVFGTKTAEKLAPRTQAHLFVDGGVVFDRARKTTERAAGMGIGFSYQQSRFTLSGLIGVPLIKATNIKPGRPILQLRLDAKTW